MDYEKEIPFGAFDSELMHQEIFIPEGFTATIEGNKITLKKIESEDEKVRKTLIRVLNENVGNGIEKYGAKLEEALAWLEKQGNPTDEDMKEALRIEYEKGRADAIAEMRVAWSEEDECYMAECINAIATKDGWSFEEKRKTKHWLEFLKERATWKPGVKNKKLTDVNHKYFSELLENTNSKDINYYAYQVAYCMSHDWIEETATWDDVQKACKLGAEWKEKQCNNSSTMWSEEDEKMIVRIRGIIEAYAFSQSAVDVNGDLCEKKFIDADNWLKSIKDRVKSKNYWKPSVGQMSALKIATCCPDLGLSRVLKTLYNDLDKLK